MMVDDDDSGYDDDYDDYDDDNEWLLKIVEHGASHGVNDG